MRTVLLCLAFFSLAGAQLDTAGLQDNTWTLLMDPSEMLTVSSNNWAYEDDWKAHPFYGFFVLGPGHTAHPQDCNFYPFDPVKKRWSKVDPPRRPPRQCLSSFAINSQDTMIIQLGGGEANHQLSQGGFDASFMTISQGGVRGNLIWAYSFNRNEWYHMKGPVTQPRALPSRYPQYDPVHDLVITSQDNNSWVYNFHRNLATEITEPFRFLMYYYETAVDTRRGIYYSLGGGANVMWAYKPDQNQWTQVTGTTIPPTPPAVNGANGIGLSMMAYDEVNDIILYIGDDAVDGSGQINTWIFHCDSLKWEQTTTIAPPRDRGMLAYNRPLNIFATLGGETPGVISRGGSTKGIWAYRYKKGAGVFAAMAKAPDARISTAGNRALVYWKPVNESGVTGYNIYRGSADPYPKNFQKLNGSPVADTFYLDATATTATWYSYKVCAVKNGVEGELSRHCYTGPHFVFNPVASVEESTVVRVSWDTLTAPDIVGYNIYRARGTGIYASFPGTYQKLNAIPVKASEFWDTVGIALKDKVARGYVVTAVNGFGLESGVSQECTTFPDSPERAFTIPKTPGPVTAFRWLPPRRCKILGVNLYRVLGDKENTTGLITDSVFTCPFPPSTGGDGYSLMGKTYVSRAVNMLGQEGFLTDQISPNNMEYGYGIATTTNRFNYWEWDKVIAAERGSEAPFASQAEVETWPNPFNPSLHVAFRMVRAGVATVSVFDAAGRLAGSRSGAFTAGRHTERFDFADAPSGVYFVRVVADGQMFEKRAILVR